MMSFLLILLSLNSFYLKLQVYNQWSRTIFHHIKTKRTCYYSIQKEIVLVVVDVDVDVLLRDSTSFHSLPLFSST